MARVVRGGKAVTEVVRAAVAESGGGEDSADGVCLVVETDTCEPPACSASCSPCELPPDLATHHMMRW